MFARRLSGLLKIRDQRSFLRLTRNPPESNLKYSVFFSKKLVEFSNLSRHFCSTQQMSNVSNLSEDPKPEVSPDTSDTDNTRLIRRRRRSTENEYAYDYLRNSEKYKKTIIPPIVPDEPIPSETVDKILRKKWKDIVVSEILEDFRILSYHVKYESLFFQRIIPITDEHEKIFHGLVSIADKLITDQLHMLLRYLQMWYPRDKDHGNEITASLEDKLDDECWKRAADWSADELLMTCDLFSHLGGMKKSKFVSNALRKLGKKPRKLSAANYVHYMFLVNVSRGLFVNMYELEYRLEPILYEFTAEELAIIAMAFFKTQTPIVNSKITVHIIQKCIDGMDNLGEIFVCAVVKMARHSLRVNHREIVRPLIYSIRTRIDTISTITLVHTIHTAATTLVYDERPLTTILNELVIRGFSKSRLKDIERALFSAMIFEWPKESPLYENALTELRNPRRTMEQARFAKTYACSLMFLAYADIYPLDLIRRILDPDYLKHVYKNNAFRIGKEYLFLECSLKLEVPEYTGPFLPEKIYSYLAKKSAAPIVWTHSAHQRSQSYRKFCMEVIHYLKDIVKGDNYTVDQVLPHHMRADIILCTDSDNNFVDPSPMLAASPNFSIKFAPTNNHKWFALILGSHNHIFSGSMRFNGSQVAKLRQLKRAGYTPIPMAIPMWVITAESERPSYLRNVLAQYITMND